VSNWRKRYPDFPEPSGGSSTSPLFSRAEVRAWLERTGKGEQSDLEGASDTPARRDTYRDPVRRLRNDLMYRRHSIALDAMVALLPAGEQIIDMPADGGLPPLEDYAAAAGTLGAVSCIVPLADRRWTEWNEDLASDPRWVFGVPGPRDVALAWVQHCYWLLQPGGTSVVSVPSRTAVSMSGRSIRAELVRSGALTAVIGMPTGQRMFDAAAVQLWVLRRPEARVAHTVRMTDLHSLRFPELPGSRDEWHRLLTDPQRSREVPAIELLDELVNLLPTSVALKPDETVVDEFESAWGTLPGLFSKINEGLPRLDRGPGRDVARDRPTITLGDLEQAGALELFIRDAEPQVGDILLRPGSAAPHVLESSKSLPRRPSASMLTVRLSEGAPYDRYFVGAFIASELARLSPPGDPVGVPPRAILRHCRIPRLPLDEQRQLGTLFRRLYELDSDLQAMARTGQKAVNTAIYGLTTGALASPSG
jgi:hypothetical protein